MIDYFKLHYRMTNRRLKDAGLEPLLGYLILSLGFFGLSIHLLNTTEFAVYIYLLLALTLVSKLSETRRLEFLKICYGDARMKTIRILENLVHSLPFLVLLLYKQLFPFAALLLALTALLALVNFRTSLNFTIWTPFSKRPFEFTVGFRNTFYLILAAYALVMVAVSVNNFHLGLFALLFVFATTLSYYSKPENEYYVWTYSQKPKQFLLQKIKTALLYSSCLALPIAVVLSGFFFQDIGTVLICFVVGWAFLITILLAKYSAYPYEMSISQGVLLAIALWFPPILIVLIPYLFQKSQKQLSHLLK